MARPKNKTELLTQSEANFNKLLTFVDGLPAGAVMDPFPEGFLNRDVRDVLAHLHHWHLMFQQWYRIGMAGDQPAMPAPGYSWKTTPELNREIWRMYHDTPLAEVREKLAQSHADIQALIEGHTDDELFTKKYYKWTGSTSLGAYLISATSSHYDWALKLIKKCRKQQLAVT
jgi:hypothetical protein